MRFQLVPTNSPLRSVTEAHIRQVYADSYGARIDSFAPLLAAVLNAGGEVLCAAGIRTAASGFFSDRYLDQSFTEALKQQRGLEIAPAQIMEITSLAAVSPFPVLPMLDRITDWARRREISCGVFTATRGLRRLLSRARLGHVALCPARPERVADPAAWGRYYDCDPWVCAVIDDRARLPRLTPGGRAIEQREAI